MADSKPSDTALVNTSLMMKVEGPIEDHAPKQENSMNKVGKVEEIKACNSNSFKTIGTSPFTSDHNRIGKSILKPSLLSLNTSSASSNFILRQTSFNPFNKSSLDYKSDNSDKKQTNGEAVKFVPLIKADSQKAKSADFTQTNNTCSTTTATPTFVFGQNLQERVRGNTDTKLNDSFPSTSSVNSNGDSPGSSDMLFSSAIKKEDKSDILKDKETKSLTESAREYEESRASKRKYEEVQVKTGEEEETNVISVSCKLFLFDKTTSNWQERGRGILRLNDSEIDDHVSSRLVFRTAGSLRVVLNTKIWAEMTIDKASEKSIRFTAIDSNGEIKVFLVTVSIFYIISQTVLQCSSLLKPKYYENLNSGVSSLHHVLVFEETGR